MLFDEYDFKKIKKCANWVKYEILTAIDDEELFYINIDYAQDIITALADKIEKQEEEYENLKEQKRDFTNYNPEL